jgi:hypothetical protein
MRTVIALSWWAASGPNIQPNDTGLPGVSEAKKIVGALLTFGLIAAVAGVAISAIGWALGSHSANPHLAGRGKVGVIVAAAAALLIGGADLIINFFQSAGSSL